MPEEKGSDGDNRVYIAFVCAVAVVIATIAVCVTIYETAKLTHPPRSTAAAQQEKP